MTHSYSLEPDPSAGQLGLEIQQELAQVKYINMTHGRSYCYNKGCRGPLCTRANRERYWAKHPDKHKPVQTQFVDQYLQKKQEEYEHARELNDKQVQEYLLGVFNKTQKQAS